MSDTRGSVENGLNSTHRNPKVLAVFSANESSLLPRPVFLNFLSIKTSSMESAFSSLRTFIKSSPAMPSGFFSLWHCNSPYPVLYLKNSHIDRFSTLWFEISCIFLISSQVCLLSMLGNVQALYFFLILYSQAHRCIKNLQDYCSPYEGICHYSHDRYQLLNN